MSKDAPTVKRRPFMIGERTIALITLFTRETDGMADLWTNEYIDYYAQGTEAAQEFLHQLKDEWTPHFLMELRKAITAMLAEHDKEFGTRFADDG